MRMPSMISSSASLVSIDAGDEFAASEAAPAARPAQHRRGVERGQHRRPFGRRVGQGEAAAQRAAIADRAVGEGRRGTRHQPARGIGHQPVLDRRVGHAGAEGHRRLVLGECGQPRQCAMSISSAGRGQPQIHHGEQGLPAGHDPRLAVARRQQTERLAEALRPDIIEGRSFHDLAPGGTGANCNTRSVRCQSANISGMRAGRDGAIGCL